MTDSEPGRLHVFHDSSFTSELVSGPVTTIEVACGQFRTATGWPLRVVSRKRLDTMSEPLWSAPLATETPVGESANDEQWLVLEQPSAEKVSSDAARLLPPVEAAIALATTLCQMYRELARERRTLIAREAELAAGVPLVVRADEKSELAERLASVLQGGAEGIGCQAAGLYMLDAATTELKLRSCWGLPSERLLEPARELASELADLEALMGSAVVLDNESLMAMWKAPEASGYAAAVCVPVASNMTILGTLWMFCRDERGFSDRETNLAEIIAGRLAVELEREMLLSEMANASRINQTGKTTHTSSGTGFAQGDSSRLSIADLTVPPAIDRISESFDATTAQDNAENFRNPTTQQNEQVSLPIAPPDLEHLDVAAMTESGSSRVAGLYDWFTLPDGRTAITLGHAQEASSQPGLAVQSLRSALRAHGEHISAPGELLRRTSETIWQASAGDQWASGALAAFEESTGKFEFCGAGDVHAIVLGRADWRPLTTGPPLLGVSPDNHWNQQSGKLRSGETLLIFTLDGLDPSQLELVDEHLATSLGARVGATAEQLLESTLRVLDTWQAYEPTAGHDRSLLIVHRK